MKADQIKNTGAEIVIAPCHNCRDQIMKDLGKELRGHMGTATTKRPCTCGNCGPCASIMSPGAGREIEAGHAARDAQFERDGVELDEEE